jgi:hypothetical protein
MADKPVNVNMNTLRTGLAGRGAFATLSMSADSDPIVLGVDEVIDVRGLKVLVVYAAGALAAAEVSHTTGGTFVPLHDDAGAITVTANTARILDVSGIAFIQFTTATTVVVAS